MGFQDVVSRADLIINKYAKFETGEKTLGPSTSKDYRVAYKQLRAQYDDLQKIVEELSSVAIPVSAERAAKLNAELKRNKMLLMQGIEGLRGLVTKGDKVTKAIIQDRNDEIEALITASLKLPDDIRGAKRETDPKHAEAIRDQEASAAFNPPVYIKGLKNIDSTETDEAAAFRAEWELARRRQDERLETLREELESVAEVAGRIANTLNQQKGVLEVLEERVDNNSGALDSQNRKLKGAVEKMAGPFKCCAYSFLIIILVAMGGWAFFHFTGVQFLPSEDPNIATPTPTPTVTTDKPLPPDIGIASSLAVPEAAPTGDATNPA